MSLNADDDGPVMLAGEFPPASDDAWRDLVEKTLRGKPFDKVMRHQTHEGFMIDALSVKPEEPCHRMRPDIPQRTWDITVPHWNPDAAKANAEILEDLLRGASGLALRLEAGYMPGIPVAELGVALEGVYLDLVRTDLIPGEEYRAATAAFLGLVETRALPFTDIKGTLGIDPFGTLAQTGRLLEPVAEALQFGAETAQNLVKKGSALSAFTVDTGVYHQAGATNSEELGLAMATGLSYLRAMEIHGLDLDKAAEQIQFSITVDADIFLSVAKFRAARLMWASILKACGVAGKQMRLAGVNSLRMLSINDPWVNILRSTAACFAAGTGGADAICLLPHDTLIGMPGASARRISRNIQIILQEESSLSHIADPAAGSYSIEAITSSLLDSAWKYMQKIESLDGVEAGLKAGSVQQDLALSWQKRAQALAVRKEPVTGVSEFPDIHERKITGIGDFPAPSHGLKPAAEAVEPLPFHRLSEDFEKLRAHSDACLAKNGTRPAIFLANIGTVAEFTARATFAKNFFEAGGIEAIGGAGGTNIDDIVVEFKETAAAVVILTSMDAQYADCGVQVVEALKKAGAKAVYVAGYPENAAQLEQAGVDAFVKLGSNVLDILTATYAAMGEAL